jgi:hypothetical protein
VSEQDACVSAHDMLAMTKQRWPDEPSGNPGQLPEKTCSPGCETATEPDRVPAKVPSDDKLRRLDAMRRDEGETVTVVEFDAAPETTPPGEEVRSEVRSEPDPAVAMTGPGSTQADRWLPGEIGAESPEPVMYAVQWDADDTPDAECCYRTSTLAHRCLADAGGKGTVVPLYAVPVDAARELAAARRETDEAKKECERLRMTQEEREAIEFAMTNLDWPPDAAQFAILARCLGPSCTMPEHVKKSALRGLLARHDKGGAA